jgi:transglutaminase/protease-like cytokinesis protein 3
MTTEEKIKSIHDYLIDNTEYDKLKSENINDDTYKSNTAYGVLIQGYGICSGYSDAMAIFLNELEIDNYKISNDTHIWNLVHINDVWVHLDSTWDDPISEFNANRDTYFLISYEDLVNLNDDTHSFDKNIYKGYSLSVLSDKSECDFTKKIKIIF